MYEPSPVTSRWNKHALRRQLVFANQGELRRRRTEDQDLEGECITLLTNAVITWNTIYTEAAMNRTGFPGDSISWEIMESWED